MGMGSTNLALINLQMWCSTQQYINRSFKSTESTRSKMQRLTLFFIILFHKRQAFLHNRETNLEKENNLKGRKMN